jgi:tRNA A-37 threonylcarbamoyl transferase component Bud32
MALDRPRAFGDYQLLATLAKGGMGAIHLAKRVGFRPDIQLFCVVKTLRPTRHDARAMLRRFEDEARIVVTLNHRAICHVFDVGLVDGEHYLAMELIEGVSVRALFFELERAHTRLDPALALAVLDEVLDALEYAHTHEDPQTGAALHIVHRDVSPQNIMLSFQGAVKLIDFGIVSSSVKLEQTEGGMVVGKLAYMAPEQARGEPIDARTDVFSAAVVLYELVTGRRYYGELSKGAIQLHLVEGTYAAPLDDVPAEMRGPLSRALAAEPKDRTASAARFQAELASCGIARASGREVRALLLRVLPHAMAELQALQRGASDVENTGHARMNVRDAPSLEGPTQVTHIAYAPDVLRSLSEGRAAVDARDDGDARDDAVGHEPALLESHATAHASQTPHTRRWTLPAMLASVVVLAAAAALFWPSRALDDTAVLTAVDDDERASVEGAAAQRAPTDEAATRDTATRIVTAALDGGSRSPSDGERDAPIRDRERALNGEAREAPVVDDDDTRSKPRTAAKPVRRPPRNAKPKTPPQQDLPDLAAHFSYLEKWCTVRAPTCARAVLSKRAHVAALDVIGLRALFRDAERCVVACRR